MYSTVLVCGGSGSRTGLDYNKMFLKIDQKTVFEKSIQLFIDDLECNEIIVVCKKEEQILFESLCHDDKICFCSSGSERQESVYNGLQCVNNEKVLIHDGARPFLTKESLNDIVESLYQYPASSLMVPCIDTVKVVQEGKVLNTLERSTLMMVQTPQAFDTQLIKKCYQKAFKSHAVLTDDCSVIELFSDIKVQCVLGDYNNVKITTKTDVHNLLK